MVFSGLDGAGGGFEWVVLNQTKSFRVDFFKVKRITPLRFLFILKGGP